MAATLEQKFQVAKMLVNRFQAAASMADRWWIETRQFRESPRLMTVLTEMEKRDLLADWALVLAEAQAAAAALPPANLLTWEPDVSILDKLGS